MNRIRPAAVAGLFYPREPGQMHRVVAQLLEENPYQGPVEEAIAPKAVVVPHAGLVYSGPIAARAYNLLKEAIRRGRHWRRVLMLGPNHRVPLRGVAAPDADLFAIPGTTLALDTLGLEALEARFDVQVRADVHALEHCLEVQLPFLQELSPSLRLLPLVVGQTAPHSVAAIVRWAWQQGDVLVLVSSDLSHYHSYEQARQLDSQTDNQIRNCSDALQPEQACGCHALNGLLLAAREEGYRVAGLDLRNSGDTAGPRDQVVGYGSYVVY